MTPPRVANTRDEAPDGPLARALRDAGLDSWPCPTISIGPPDDPGSLAQALGALDRTDWVVFTSAHAVDATCSRPEWREAVRVGAVPRLAAIGPATARQLVEHGHAVDCVPDQAAPARLAAALVARSGTLTGARVLWPRANLARRTLAVALARAGATVVSPVAYITRPVSAASLAPLLAEARDGRLDAIAFCSPSSAEQLVSALSLPTLATLTDGLVVASIGPTTSAALVALGVPPHVEAPTPSASSLAASLASRLLATSEMRS
jgi:uroporphyrinogen-III synthase